MRAWLLVLVLAAGCRTASLPGGGGDGGAPADLAFPDGGRPCAVLCAMGLVCCDGSCVNLRNDIRNCGACGVTCSGAQPYCNGNACTTAPCLGYCVQSALERGLPQSGLSAGPVLVDQSSLRNGTCP